ncbi:hypothetical protein GCM10023238_23540 [Streptomyces heliomycini]
MRATSSSSGADPEPGGGDGAEPAGADGDADGGGEPGPFVSRDDSAPGGGAPPPDVPVSSATLSVTCAPARVRAPRPSRESARDRFSRSTSQIAALPVPPVQAGRVPLPRTAVNGPRPYAGVPSGSAALGEERCEGGDPRGRRPHVEQRGDRIAPAGAGK